MHTGFLPTASLQIRAQRPLDQLVQRLVVVELGLLARAEHPADLRLERALQPVAHLRVVGQPRRLDPGVAERPAALVDDDRLTATLPRVAMRMRSRTTPSIAPISTVPSR